MDTLIKIWRDRGQKPRAENRKTLITIGKIDIEISLREKQRIERGQGKYSFETSYIPTGVLILQSRISYQSKEWADGKVLLENQLSKLISGIETQARNWQEEQDRIDAYWEKQREKERIEAQKRQRKKDELKAFQEIFLEANRYQQAAVIRRYADELEKHEHHSPSEELKTKIEWIRSKADLDPFINTPDELLDGFDKNDALQHKKV